MSLRAAAAHAFSVHLHEARVAAVRAARAGVVTTRDVQWRDARLPAIPALPALPAVSLALPALPSLPSLPSLPAVVARHPRAGLAVAAVGGVTIASVAAAVVVRRRRNLLVTRPEDAAAGELPSVAAYPGPDNRWDRIAVGVLADGVPADIRLGYSPHVLVVGNTGSGKSIVGRSILFHCLAHADDWNIVGIDLSKVELSYLHGYDTATVTTSLEEAATALTDLSAEMDLRYRTLENEGVNHFRDLPAPPKAILVYVDEAGYFTPQPATGEKVEAQNLLSNQALGTLGRIARLGRAVGIHLVLSTQRADPHLLSDLYKNLDARIVMGKTAARDTEATLGNDAATHLPPVRGRGLLSTFGNAEEFQSYFAPQDWYDDYLAAQQDSERSVYHPVTLLRTPSGVVICTKPAARTTVTEAIARLDATAEIRAVIASTPAEIKQALRRNADVIGYVGSLDDPKALDRIVWAGTVGCVVYVAAPQQSYDDLAERLARKADQRQVGCQIVADA